MWKSGYCIRWRMSVWMADVTLKQGVETMIKDNVPSISEVIDATDHAAGENPFLLIKPSLGRPHRPDRELEERLIAPSKASLTFCSISLAFSRAPALVSPYPSDHSIRQWLISAGLASGYIGLHSARRAYLKSPFRLQQSDSRLCQKQCHSESYLCQHCQGPHDLLVWKRL